MGYPHGFMDEQYYDNMQFPPPGPSFADPQIAGVPTEGGSEEGAMAQPHENSEQIQKPQPKKNRANLRFKTKEEAAQEKLALPADNEQKAADSTKDVLSPTGGLKEIPQSALKENAEAQTAAAHMDKVDVGTPATSEPVSSTVNDTPLSDSAGATAGSTDSAGSTVLSSPISTPVAGSIEPCSSTKADDGKGEGFASSDAIAIHVGVPDDSAKESTEAKPKAWSANKGGQARRVRRETFQIADVVECFRRVAGLKDLPGITERIEKVKEWLQKPDSRASLDPRSAFFNQNKTADLNVDGKMDFFGTMSQPTVQKPNSKLNTLTNRAEQAFTAQDKSRLEAKEQLLSKVRSIFNKITPDKYEPLKAELLNLDLTSQDEDFLKSLVAMIFEKAIDLKEEQFAYLYAKLCHDICANYHTLEKAREKERKPDTASEPGTPLVAADDSAEKQEKSKNAQFYSQFRRILLSRCQEVFDKQSPENRGEEDVQVIPKEVKAEQESRHRDKMIGNIRFVAELFKRALITEKIMHQIIFRLLYGPEYQKKADKDFVPPSLDIELFCELIKPVGKQLSHDYMGAYFKQVDHLINNEQHVNMRNRCQLLNILDLKNNGWDDATSHQAKTQFELEKELTNKALQKETAAMGRGYAQNAQNARSSGSGDRRGRGAVSALPPSFKNSTSPTGNVGNLPPGKNKQVSGGSGRSQPSTPVFAAGVDDASASQLEPIEPSGSSEETLTKHAQTMWSDLDECETQSPNAETLWQNIQELPHQRDCAPFFAFVIIALISKRKGKDEDINKLLSLLSDFVENKEWGLVVTRKIVVGAVYCAVDMIFEKSLWEDCPKVWHHLWVVVTRMHARSLVESIEETLDRIFGAIVKYARLSNENETLMKALEAGLTLCKNDDPWCVNTMLRVRITWPLVREYSDENDFWEGSEECGQPPQERTLESLRETIDPDIIKYLPSCVVLTELLAQNDISELWESSFKIVAGISPEASKGVLRQIAEGIMCALHILLVFNNDDSNLLTDGVATLLRHATDAAGPRDPMLGQGVLVAEYMAYVERHPEVAQSFLHLRKWLTASELVGSDVWA